MRRKKYKLKHLMIDLYFNRKIFFKYIIFNVKNRLNNKKFVTLDNSKSNDYGKQYF